MFNKVENIKDEIILMTLSEIVPKDHFLRKVDKAIDFKFIYDLTEEYYSHTSGRNCLDPVVLFKLVFLKDFYGIKSMRETIKRIETDAAFRWFLGIPFSKPVPHYSTFSQNYIRRFQGTDVFEQIFINIVNQAIDKKLVGGTEFFTDSTHIKAMIVADRMHIYYQLWFLNVLFLAELVCYFAIKYSDTLYKYIIQAVDK